MRDLGKQPVIIIGPVVISLVALGLGVAGFIRDSRIESEQRAVDVEIEASTTRPRQFQMSGLVLTASLANESLRSILIRRAELWVGDQRIESVTGYSEAEPGAERLRFPLTLEAREGRTIRLFMGGDQDLLGRCFTEWPKYVPVGADRRQCRLWRTALIPAQSKERPQLHVRLAPGGVEEYPVRLSEPSGPGETGWDVQIAGRRKPLLSLRHDGTGPTSGIVRLDLWRFGRYQFHRSFHRPLLVRHPFEGLPVSPRIESAFPLPPLERGFYEYAFRVEGRAVMSGCFRIPAEERVC